MTVFERAERPGGLLRYGIPEFKMEKAVLDRRLAQMEAEGVTFVCSTAVGGVDGAAAGGGAPGRARRATRPRDGERPRRPGAPGGRGAGLRRRRWCWPVGRPCRATFPCRGARSRGVHFAMEYLKPSNLVQEGALASPPIDARGKRVVIIGGGDTGADCLGTVHRQGAVSVHQLEIMAEPPSDRLADNPWPLWPLILRTSSAHEEGGERLFAVTTTDFLDDGAGAVRALRGHAVEVRSEDGRPVFEVVPGTEFDAGVRPGAPGHGLRRHRTERRGGRAGGLGRAAGHGGDATAQWATNVDGVFVCGDQTRGQSLIVWAIAEGRSCAAAVDRWLMGTTSLPAPLVPGQLALR